MPRAFFLALLSVVGCASHNPTEPEPIEVAEPEPAVMSTEVEIPDAPEEPSEPEPPLPPGERRVDVEIVGEGPIGCGNCTSKPYEVALTDGSARFWVLYQHCEGDPPLPPSPLSPEGLDVGGRYQLTLRKGGEDFGDTPELIAADNLP